MTGPGQEPHAVLAGVCFFGVVLIVIIDVVHGLLGGAL